MYILSVSEIDAYLRELLAADMVLSDVWVEGEISNFRRVASGHCYFSLKEGDAVLEAVMWRSHAARMDSLPTSGDAVLAHGYVSFYEAAGKLQLYVDTMRAAGVGLLYARFQQLQARLESEGLFDPSRKRALPALPRRVGLVTSGQAAALQDMLTVLARRCPLVEVLIAPCLVQGDRAPESIVAALTALYAAGVDVIIVARGGGSIEDLWAFNEEVVARAVFASPVPVVTGVGHETDTTIVDYVADVRAPTPSAAAELVVPDRAELRLALTGLWQQLDAGVARVLAEQYRRVASTRDQLQRHNPALRLPRARQDVDGLLRRGDAALAYALSLRRARLQGVQARLEALSPRATLERGYAVVQRAADGAVVAQAGQVTLADELEITLLSGRLVARVTRAVTGREE